MPVCNLCQAGHASLCPLANRESEQTAPRDALLFGTWQCNTYAAICKIWRFALSGLVHPHSDACVRTVLPRSCIYMCPLASWEAEQAAPRDALLFGSWQCNTYADKCNIKRFALSGLEHPHSDACVQTVLPWSCIYVSPLLL